MRGAVAVLMSGAFLFVGGSTASSAIPARFRWFTAAPAPAGWKQLVSPSDGAILSFPPSLARIHSDRASISVARKDRAGRILVYLNSTPKQGDERLDTWARYRIRHNRGESDAVHEEAHETRLSFLGAKGSCVMDDYVTRVKVHRYREIACFVQGRRAASVIVAAALRSEWTRAAPLLERAVAAYRVGRYGRTASP
jgi:hypothetical protein